MADWDQRQDWVLLKTYDCQKQLSIPCRRGGNAAELAGARRLVPDLRNMPPSKLKARVSDGMLELGVFRELEARHLIELASELGVDLRVEDRSTVSYLPFNRTGGTAWLIEDDREALRIANEMMEAGVPVEVTHID